MLHWGSLKISPILTVRAAGSPYLRARPKSHVLSLRNKRPQKAGTSSNRHFIASQESSAVWGSTGRSSSWFCLASLSHVQSGEGKQGLEIPGAIALLPGALVWVAGRPHSVGTSQCLGSSLWGLRASPLSMASLRGVSEGCYLDSLLGGSGPTCAEADLTEFLSGQAWNQPSVTQHIPEPQQAGPAQT